MLTEVVQETEFVVEMPLEHPWFIYKLCMNSTIPKPLLQQKKDHVLLYHQWQEQHSDAVHRFHFYKCTHKKQAAGTFSLYPNYNAISICFCLTIFLIHLKPHSFTKPPLPSKENSNWNKTAQHLHFFFIQYFFKRQSSLQNHAHYSSCVGIQYGAPICSSHFPHI